ncbi:MAG: dehydrogenase, partial [Verrucomicrobiales bacterium VVV1]
MKSVLILSALLLGAAVSPGAPTVAPLEDARRLEVLFLGAPTANHPAHDPVERYRVVRKHLGVSGINFTYTENLADLKPEVLNHYDAVMLYGNWASITPEQEKSLVEYVESGHGFLPIHCASACFEKSESYGKLVGGHFKSHGTGVFRTTIVAPEHPVMKGYKDFETWDETYVHDRLTSDRTLLQKREEEPWTWVRTQGKGRIFYTAYGHDMRCWNQPEFNDLLRRGILWSVNDATRAKLYALKLPKLEMEKMELPGYKERKLNTEGQKPLSQEESMKLAQVPNGFELSLFAAEPDIINPIYVNWDARGRAFVVQTVDYPNNLQAKNLGHDSIKICEDTNGDGKADKFTVFADHLNIPTGFTFARGGIVVSQSPRFLFLKDTDGDDKADVRTEIMTGWGINDTHAQANNLHYGLDNWLYGAGGYSGFKGTIGGVEKQFAQGTYRFKADGSALEF